MRNSSFFRVLPLHAERVGEQDRADEHRQDPEGENDIGEPLGGPAVVGAVTGGRGVAAADQRDDAEQDREDDPDDHEAHRPLRGPLLGRGHVKTLAASRSASKWASRTSPRSSPSTWRGMGKSQ